MNRQFAIIDTCVVSGVSLSYVVFEALHVAKRWSFLTVGVVLGVYAFYFARRRSPSWRELGFRTDNLRAGLIPVGVFTLFASGGLVGWGLVRSLTSRAPDILLLLALYPAWAVVQQFAFQGLLHRSLMALFRSSAPPVLLSAAAFSAVHAGNPTLVGLTFLAGLSWSVLYRRWPSIWLLAASHTVLAALAYPLVLGDAPLSRL